jgi:Tol biopolymer transport system component
MRRIPVFVVVAGVMLVVLVAPAGAAFPGSNGRLAYWDFVGEPPQIFTIDPDGTNRARLTDTTNAINEDPAWSEDGARIAFARFFVSSGASSLRLMDADGSNVSVVLTVDDLPSGFVFISEPAWAPDGTMLSFCAFRNTSFENKVFTVGTNGTGLTKLSGPDDDECSPAWSPDGAKIAVEGIDADLRGDIVLLAADGSTRVPIVTAGDTRDPNWDPTGAQLAFTRRINKRTDVYTTNADGSGLMQVTDTAKRWEFAPAWAPDGSRIAFSRTVGADSLTIQDLWTIAPDGTDPDRVTDTPGMDELAPDWQPV